MSTPAKARALRKLNRTIKANNRKRGRKKGRSGRRRGGKK